MSLNRILVALGLGAGAWAGFNYLRKMSLTDKYLEIIPSAMIHKVNLAGVFIRMDIRFKNPDGGSFKIKYPHVRLNYEGESIGSSQVIDKEIQIPAYGEAVVNGIMIEIPIASILTTGYKVYKTIIEGKPVKMQCLTHTTIIVGLQTMPYDKVVDFTLKK
jgi:hypothetical protein